MIEPVLYNKYVEQAEKSFIMIDGVLLTHKKYNKYAMDVRFQQNNRPAGSFVESRNYVSGEQD